MTTVSDLRQMKEQIEKMDKINQIDILKILRDSNKVILNENKSGVYVNLTYCPQNTIDEIVKYLDYATEQEKDNVKIEFFNNIE